MIKICILLSLAIAGTYGQYAPGGTSSGAASTGGEAAPEPYSYGYQTDTHAAAEQKDPNGRVTGYYTLTDADGRGRRVEYYADESGFHAKVQTNELGTKSENSADVEVLASPPTSEQYAYQQTPFVEQQQQQQQQQQRAVQAVVQPSAAQARVQQGYGYYPGQSGYYSQYRYAGPSYGVQYPAEANYGSGFGATYGSAAYGSGYNGVYSGYNNRLPYGYNNHLPSSYYAARSAQTVSNVQPSSYSVGGGASRYTVSNPAVGVAGSTGSSYRTVGVPFGVGYQSSVVGPQRVGYTSQVGSPNYIVLKKRELEANVQTEAKTDKQ